MSNDKRPLGGPRRRVLRRLALGFLASGSLAIGTCDDSSGPATPCPPSAIGVLEGQVRIAGRAVAIGVGARLLDDPGTIVAETRSDANGRYRLALPPGIYRIELDPRTGLGYTSSNVRDTVRVAAGVRHLDLLRGTLSVQVAIPQASDGERYSCTLQPPLPLDLSTTFATARDGHVEFAFPIIDPGTYRMQLRTNDFPGFWLPGTDDSRAADVVIVGSTHAVVYRTTVRNCATVAGTIRGSWQETSVSPPTVFARTLAGRAWGRTRCASDGSFRLQVFDVQPVRLLVSIAGIDQWIGGDALETATTFDLQPGQHVEGVSLVEGGILCDLEGPGLLTSYRAQVEIHERSGRTYETGSTYEKSIAICNLLPGSYRLYVHGDCDFDGEPWASQWYDRADSIEAATLVEVAAGHATHITMTLDHDGRIEGRVLDAAGDPTPTVVTVYRDSSPLCPGMWYPSANAFSLRGLGNGDYTLAAVLGDALWWYPGTANADSARVLRIRDHATLSGIEWRLPGLDREDTP